MATRLTPKPQLHQLTVTVPSEAEEAVSLILEDFFAQWPAAYSEPESSHTELSLFLRTDQRPSRARLQELVARVRALAALDIPVGKAQIRIVRMADRNWKQSWKRHFKPLEVGRRLLLRPSWSRRKAKHGQKVVVIDPGLSFGTGQHPTTSFCLQELVRHRKERLDQSFLDIGTGSGILAIAAAKLGYKPVHGFDNDPQSVSAALANARRNRIDHRLRFRREDLSALPRQGRLRYDVVCANLLADLLTTQAGRILNRVKPGGVLVIAGILSSEFKELERHFISLGTRPLRTRTKGEWRSGSYRIPA